MTAHHEFSLGEGAEDFFPDSNQWNKTESSAVLEKIVLHNSCPGQTLCLGNDDACCCLASLGGLKPLVGL